jgi:hypothetical protein
MPKHAREVAFLSTVLISAAAAVGASRLGSPSLTVHEGASRSRHRIR